MTKADIVRVVYNRIGGISKKESADLVERLIRMIKETLARGENLKISGFGNFITRQKRARIGINPKTRAQITLPPHRVVKFKASHILKGAINGSEATEAGDDEADTATA